jgi:hypothetical protein
VQVEQQMQRLQAALEAGTASAAALQAANASLVAEHTAAGALLTAGHTQLHTVLGTALLTCNSALVGAASMARSCTKGPLCVYYLVGGQPHHQ